MVNGWTLTFHAFDYNLDHLGLGTIDDPAWKVPDRQASYLERALAYFTVCNARLVLLSR